MLWDYFRVGPNPFGSLSIPLSFRVRPHEVFEFSGVKLKNSIKISALIMGYLS